MNTTDIIRHELKRAGRSQKELAAFIPVTENGLKKMFDNDSYKTETLNKIAEFLQKDVSELLNSQTKVGLNIVKQMEEKDKIIYNLSVSNERLTRVLEHLTINK